MRAKDSKKAFWFGHHDLCPVTVWVAGAPESCAVSHSSSHLFFLLMPSIKSAICVGIAGQGLTSCISVPSPVCHRPSSQNCSGGLWSFSESKARLEPQEKVALSGLVGAESLHAGSCGTGYRNPVRLGAWSPWWHLPFRKAQKN